MSYNSLPETEKHIKSFKKFLTIIINDLLLERLDKHDLSKIKEPEKSVLDEVTPLLKKLTYGSDEYNKNVEIMKPALDHHYKHNRHHPEHFKNGMKDMTLVDVVEMFCDWCAATDRHDDGDITKSIKHNAKRFGYDEVLANIFANTAREYGMGKGHSDIPKTISLED